MSDPLVLFGVAIGSSVWSLLMVLVGWAMAKGAADDEDTDALGADDV